MGERGGVTAVGGGVFGLPKPVTLSDGKKSSLLAAAAVRASFITTNQRTSSSPI